MGTGTNGFNGSSDQTRKLGVAGVADMFKFGYDNGVTFWDSADQYGSHPHLREALKSVQPRERHHPDEDHASTEAGDEGANRSVSARAEHRLHRHPAAAQHAGCATWPDEKKGAMEVIDDAQARGIVHTKGTSCHTLEALKTSAASKWVEVDLARINPARVAMDADPEVVLGVLKQMKASGKA